MAERRLCVPAARDTSTLYVVWARVIVCEPKASPASSTALLFRSLKIVTVEPLEASPVMVRPLVSEVIRSLFDAPVSSAANKLMLLMTGVPME